MRDQGTTVAVQSSGRRIEFLFIGLLVIAMGWVLYRVEISPTGPVVETIAGETRLGVLPNSVAVLPFRSLSPDPDDAFYADGIHIELLNLLHKIQGLTAVARDSVIALRDTTLSNAEIAQRFRVQTVMRGDVRYAGDSVRVFVELIDPKIPDPVWSGIYEGNLSDLFAFQAEIATNIAMALEAELLPDEQQNIERAPTASPEALRLYYQAVAALGLLTGIDISWAVHAEFNQYLDDAIAADPNFALAYARKARNYAWAMIRDHPITLTQTVNEFEVLARTNARLALNIDLELGLAHSALAVTDRLNRRWAAAASECERALQFSPEDPEVLFDCAMFHRTLGHEDDAVRLANRLVEVDPAWGHWILGFILSDHGHYYESFEVLEAGIQLYPTFAPFYASLGATELYRGNTEESLAALRLVETLGYASRPARVTALLYYYGRIGSEEDVERLFVELNRLSVDYDITPGLWAAAYLSRGDHAKALEWLNIAAENRVPGNDFLQLLAIAGNFNWDPILDQPEFEEVRNRLGFTE